MPSQNYARINGRPFPGYVGPGWLSTEAQARADNDRWAADYGHRRRVVTWIRRSAYTVQAGRVPGNLILELEGGGIIRRPEGEPLEDAFALADRHGYDTTEVRAWTARYLATGEPQPRGRE